MYRDRRIRVKVDRSASKNRETYKSNREQKIKEEEDEEEEEKNSTLEEGRITEGFRRFQWALFSW